MKGTYILILELEEEKEIRIGALGELPFKKGFYIYVGSAMGEKGSTTLENRVRRHLRTSDKKKKHWHIDYLLADKKASIIRVLICPSLIKLECLLANEIKSNAESYIKNFGSSDCNCQSHLFYFKDLPSYY